MKSVRRAILLGVMTSALWTTFTADAENRTNAPSIALNWIHGPQRIDLQSGAILSLPPDYAFLRQKDTQTLLRSLGNVTRGDEIGFIAPPSPGWVVIVRFLAERHIEAAGDLDASNLLKLVQSENQRNNYQREQIGLPLVSIRGWKIPPSFDRTNHRLEWAVQAESRDKEIVNHCISILGREGVLQLFLVDERHGGSTGETFRQLAANIQFSSGKRYEDFGPRDSVPRAGVESLLVSGMGTKMPDSIRARLLKARLLFWAKLGIVGVVMGSLGFLLATLSAHYPIYLWFRFWRKQVSRASTTAGDATHDTSRINYHAFYRDLTRDLHHW